MPHRNKVRDFWRYRCAGRKYLNNLVPCTITRVLYWFVVSGLLAHLAISQLGKFIYCRIIDSEFIPVYTVKSYKGVEVQFHSFLTAALDGGEWSDSRRGCFTTERESRYAMNRKLCGLWSQSERFSERTNILPLRDSNPRSFIMSE